uniref:Uncharacterized protein n=1 Tax=Alexandrium monilatum TaxID=311494 RepID=A0A7S4WIN6_9DINO
MSTLPLLPAGGGDLEAAAADAGVADAAAADARTPQGSSGSSGSAGVPVASAGGSMVYPGSCFESLANRACAMARRWTLTSRPGYAESLCGRRGLRRLSLPAVGLASLAADAARPGGALAGALEADSWVLLALLGAAAAPLCSTAADPVFPDLAAAAAAVFHTWRGSERAAAAAAAGGGDGGAAVAVEYLVMFWLVALPLLAGTDWAAVAAYCAAMLGLWLPSARPGASVGGLAAVLLLAAPLLAAEFHSAGLCDELARRRGALKQLIAGLGGTTCSIDLYTGTVLEASPELEQLFEPPGAVGRELAELVQLPKDQDSLKQLVRAASLAGAVDDGLHAGPGVRPVVVASLRVSGAPCGAVARLLPLEASSAERKLRLLVDVRAPQDVDEGQLRFREQKVIVEEERLSIRERSLAAREGHAKELEAALAELHGLYEEGCRAMENEGHLTRHPTPRMTRVSSVSTMPSTGGAATPRLATAPTALAPTQAAATAAPEAEPPETQPHDGATAAWTEAELPKSPQRHGSGARGAEPAVPPLWAPGDEPQEGAASGEAAGTLRDGEPARTRSSVRRAVEPRAEVALQKARDLLRAIRRQNQTAAAMGVGFAPSARGAGLRSARTTEAPPSLPRTTARPIVVPLPPEDTGRLPEQDRKGAASAATAAVVADGGAGHPRRAYSGGSLPLPSGAASGQSRTSVGRTTSGIRPACSRPRKPHRALTLSAARHDEQPRPRQLGEPRRPPAARGGRPTAARDAAKQLG